MSLTPEAALAALGYDRFRPPQDQIVAAALEGRDVIVVMPTGGGKSLTYQLPALCRPGFTLVVSPLISLMQNQVAGLAARGVRALGLTSEVQPGEIDREMTRLAADDSEARLVYVSPERVMMPEFLAHLRACYAAGRIQRIAIDECHCMVEWGDDFRPEYAALGVLRQHMPTVPVIVLTASATGEVLVKITRTMALREPVRFRASFNRPNLRYAVERKQPTTIVADMFDRLVSGGLVGACGIIYCFRTADCDDVAVKLNARFARHDPAAAGAGAVFAAAYHAKLPYQERARVLNQWTANRIRVVVATIAFGMGIDKPDVRFVFHHTTSKTMENYYQESGRAGRDGQPAECVLFYSPTDFFVLKSIITSSSASTSQERTERGYQPVTAQTVAKSLAALERMREYCTKQRCRRAAQLGHFGETFDPAQCGAGGMPCDTCGAKQRTVTTYFAKKKTPGPFDDD